MVGQAEQKIRTIWLNNNLFSLFFVITLLFTFMPPLLVARMAASSPTPPRQRLFTDASSPTPPRQPLLAADSSPASSSAFSSPPPPCFQCLLVADASLLTPPCHQCLLRVNAFLMTMHTRQCLLLADASLQTPPCRRLLSDASSLPTPSHR